MRLNSSLYVSFAVVYSIFCLYVFSQGKDYTRLFKDTTYKNYWYRYNALKGLCKSPDKNYRNILLAFEHKEEPISELATECLMGLKSKKNIDDFIKRYVDGVKDKKILKKSLLVISKLSKGKLFEVLEKSPDNATKLIVLDYLGQMELDEDVLKKVYKEYLKNSSRDIKLSILPILVKYNYLKEFDKYIRSVDKDERLYGWQSICSVDNKQCEVGLINEVFGKFSNNREYFCGLVYIIKEYKIKGVLNELLERVTSMNDYFRKKMIFSLLTILDDDSFKKKVLKYWKDLTTNFLSLLLNIFSIKFNTDEVDLVEIYKNLNDSGKNGEFKTSGIPTFFSMPVYGRNIVFVIDMSGSMAKKVGGTGLYSQRKAQGGKKENFQKTRFDLAKEELEKVLNKLGINVKFNVVLINSDTDSLGIRSFSKGFVNANKSQINSAIEYLSKAWAKLQEIKRGRTDIYDSLKIALEQPNVDTIVLLTDGNPTWGQYTLPHNIVSNITKLNKCKFVSINSIAVGASRYGINFLRELSLSNYGTIRKVEWEDKK